MIVCIGVGLPLPAAAMHNRTYHGMVHAIKTRHGTLRPYSGTDDHPLEDTGHKSAASPAIWQLYSLSLLNFFWQFTPGMDSRKRRTFQVPVLVHEAIAFCMP
jgi:hypothetical protein